QLRRRALWRSGGRRDRAVHGRLWPAGPRQRVLPVQLEDPEVLQGALPYGDALLRRRERTPHRGIQLPLGRPHGARRMDSISPRRAIEGSLMGSHTMMISPAPASAIAWIPWAISSSEPPSGVTSGVGGRSTPASPSWTRTHALRT